MYILVLCWRRTSLTKKKKKKKEVFPSESEPQGEPVEASHRRVGARRLEIDSDCVVVWIDGDGGFSLFLSLRFCLTLDVGFGLLWIFVVGLLDWRGLEIKIGSRDWRSVVIAWWFGDRRQWHGGLERWRWWMLSLSLTPILSLRLDVGFGFALNFLQVQSESFYFFFKKTKIFVLFCLFVFFFFFCFDFVVRVSISNGICISSRAWIFLVGLPYLQSQ